MSDKTLLELTGLQCLQLLGAQHLGRLAFIDKVGVLPMVIPVNYLLDQDMVVFRSDPGSKLTAAILGAPVAFEVDGVDEDQRTGWSVVVRGHAEEVLATTDLERLQQSTLVPWAPGDKAHYVRVRPRQVSGRRISLTWLPSNWLG